MEQFVKISLEKYKNLVKSDCELEALRAVGVDNWCGWGEHRQFYKDSVKEQLSEENLNKIIVNE
jgi:hypothetical protein